MSNKKGFTLVELLAVIAILAILVMIALPNVLKMFRTAKQNTFVTEVQNLVRSAEDKYLTSSMLNENNTCFDSKTNKLDMTGRDDLVYVIKLTNKGKVIEVKVADKSYQLIASEEKGINRTDIGNKYVVQAVDNKTTIVGCDSTALKQESEDKELVLKKDNEEIRRIQMGRNTTTTIDKENDLALVTCNNGVEVTEENGQLKLSNILSNSVCTFSNDLSNTISNLDNTQKDILLINDLNTDKQIIINKPLTIDMNGKSINSTFDGDAIVNKTNLTIKNSSNNESSINSNAIVIANVYNLTLNLDNIKLICSNTVNGYSTIYNNGKLIVRNSHIEGPHGIGGNDSETATFDIYDSEIVGTLNNGISLNKSDGSSGNIHNSTITGEKSAIVSNSSGTINIYSGTFTGKTENGILNNSTGTINICLGEISGVTYDLRNSSTGTINYTSKVTLKNGITNGTNINLNNDITCE